MRGLVVVALCACSSSIDSPPVDPTPDADPTTPDSPSNLPPYATLIKFGHELVRSVTVHKNGGEDRIVYVEASRVAQYPSSGVLPDDTRMILEVTGGGCFVIEKLAGTWNYGSFGCNANPAVFTVGANAGCNGCHSGATEPGAWTAGSLRRLVATHVAEELVCPAGPGPTPCSADVYD